MARHAAADQQRIEPVAHGVGDMQDVVELNDPGRWVRGAPTRRQLHGPHARDVELLVRIEPVVFQRYRHRPVREEVGGVACVVAVAGHDHPVVAEARLAHRMGLFAAFAGVEGCWGGRAGVHGFGWR